MGEDIGFQKRWEFRRRDSDFDSSSFDSKSSLGSRRNKRLGLVAVDDDETSDTTLFQQKGDDVIGPASQNESGKAVKEKRAARGKIASLADIEKRSGTRKEPARKKGKAAIDENSALDDLKKYMKTLLDELKVTRKNLILWLKEEMEKLQAEEDASESNQLQNQDNDQQTVRFQFQTLFGKNILVPHQDNFDQYIQPQLQGKFEKVEMKQAINLEEDVEEQPQYKPQEKVVPVGNRSRTSTGTRNRNGGMSQKYSRRKKPADSNNRTPALKAKADNTQPILLSEPDEENGEEQLPSSDKLNAKSSPVDLNGEEKTIVLGIKAQKRNSKSARKLAKGKRAFNANSDNHGQEPNYETAGGKQDHGSIVSTEKSRGEKSGLSLGPNFTPDSFNQMPSSMYLTPPTTSVLNPSIPILKSDISPFSYVQPRIAAQNQAGLNPERANPVPGLGPSNYVGYYQSMMLSDERNRNIPPTSSTDINFFNQNNPAPPLVGNGLSAPLQNISGGFNIPSQFSSLEQMHREANSTAGLPLPMNGGAFRFPGGGYLSADQQVYMAGNLQNYQALDHNRFAHQKQT